MTTPPDDVKRGVLLSDSAVHEIVAAIDMLGQLAAPGQRLSKRLQAIRSELIRSAVTSASRDSARVGGSVGDIVAQHHSDWLVSVVDTATAARMLGITPGGVAWLCRNGRLTATRSGGRWLIDTAALRSLLTIRKER